MKFVLMRHKRNSAVSGWLKVDFTRIHKLSEQYQILLMMLIVGSFFIPTTSAIER